MKVWSYWQGPMPEYIKVCVRSIRAYCPEFVLLTPETVSDYLKGSGINPAWRNLSKPAHRADCIRVAIVNTHGGIWVDCDTIFVRRIENLIDFESFERCQFAYTRWNDGRCLNGYFYGKNGNPITAAWLEDINKKIKPGAQWTALGESILTPIINSKKYAASCFEYHRSIFLPINIDKIPAVFFEPVHYSSFMKDNTVAFGLNHSWFCDFRKDFVDSREPWAGENLINGLINDAR